MSDFSEMYLNLKKKLTIDLLRIDDEIMELPSTIQEASEYATEMLDGLATADHCLDIARAMAANKLRQVPDGTKSPSETQIASMIELDDDVKEARILVNEAKHNSRLANDLVSNLREKSHHIRKAADLIVAGYITPNAIIVKSRPPRTT